MQSMLELFVEPFLLRQTEGLIRTGCSRKEKMQINTPRRYFNKVAMMVAAVSGAPGLLAQTPAAGTSPTSTTGDRSPQTNRTHDGIYYFPGIGANSGYGREDRILVTDP